MQQIIIQQNSIGSEAKQGIYIFTFTFDTFQSP